MASNPDPTLQVASLSGTTRSLDDWMTMFHLCLVVLPDDPAAARFLPVVENLTRVLGDSDVRIAALWPSTTPLARRVLGDFADENLVFVDPSKELIASLGIEKLPALVHLRQDTTLAGIAEGWDAAEWQKVADELAEAMSWSNPEVDAGSVPAGSVSWPVE
ncbi:MAG: hypothetical protein M5U31_07105 [Acidimicrobiia bacterium]|nr:hypothetical protein [Acidimicrobiia bacterium]